MESTVVEISIPPPSFKPVALCLSRISSYSKTTQTSLFFNPIKYILTSFTTLYYTVFIIYTFFRFYVQNFIFTSVICSEMYCAPRNCGGVGECNTKLGKCDCAAGYGGPGCAKQNMCVGNCTGHGTCVASRATADLDSSSECVCEKGFDGKYL